MKAYRLNRIFERDSSRFLGVAFEESFFSSYDVVSGLDAVRALMLAGPNVLQASAQQAATWQTVSMGAKCALILSAGPETLSVKKSGSVRVRGEVLIEQALRLDAAGVTVKLSPLSKVSSVVAPSFESITRIKDECDRYGMPLMIEIPSPQRGRTVSRAAYIRHAAKLGADVIKIDMADNAAEYRDMVDASNGVPLIAIGDGGLSERETLERAETLMKSGARGIIFERTAICLESPLPMTEALKSIVHDGSSAREAAKILKEHQVS